MKKRKEKNNNRSSFIFNYPKYSSYDWGHPTIPLLRFL